MNLKNNNQKRNAKESMLVKLVKSISDNSWLAAACFVSSRVLDLTTVYYGVSRYGAECEGNEITSKMIGLNGLELGLAENFVFDLAVGFGMAFALSEVTKSKACRNLMLYLVGAAGYAQALWNLKYLL